MVVYNCWLVLANSSTCCSWKHVPGKAGLPCVTSSLNPCLAVDGNSLAGPYLSTPRMAKLAMEPSRLPSSLPYLCTSLVNTDTSSLCGGCLWLCLPSHSRAWVLEANPRSLLVSVLPPAVSALVHGLVIQQDANAYSVLSILACAVQ